MIFDNRAEDITIINYQSGDTDEYGDASTETSEIQTKGLIDRAGGSNVVRNERGEIIDSGLRVFVSDDTDVFEVSDENPQASKIIRETTGKEYTVQTTFYMSTGYIRCECDRSQ